ncbi:MAG: PRC and DUF2382 domain-containing protein [Brooklawnia sp.]|uniref:DUF2382 domain-containing protein n=1 Tax=Brooklawnia sp. TaxID=2699740 RepID=UPI003C7414E5
MISTESITRLSTGGGDVLDSTGDKIGSIAQLYVDDRSTQPSWVTVRTGLFGMRESFVPLDDATEDGINIRVPYTKDQVKDAPNIDADEHLSPEEEQRLYRHYGLSAGGTGEVAGQTSPLAGQTERSVGQTGPLAGQTERSVGQTDPLGGRPGQVTGEQAGYAADVEPRADEGLVRSEERLNVGTEQEEVGRARLRKYVVTENVQTTVPVTREEVRVEREPITSAEAADVRGGVDLGQAEQEVVLRAERPVVETETVPVEKVRLEKDTVTEDQTVTGQVRKEQVEAERDEPFER